jgi:phage replication O-like protein O
MSPPSPQLENGYTRIANELLEAMAKAFPGKAEGQVLFAILRKTFGWRKKEDDISISQIVGMTGLSRRMAIYSIQNLEAKRMISVKRKRGAGVKNQVNTISFQENYDIWVVQEKSRQYKNVIEKRKLNYKKSKKSVVQEMVSSARNASLVVQEMEKNGRFLAPTKETIYKRKTKEREPSFPKSLKTFLKVKAEEIYQSYPKKADRPNSIKSITRILESPPPDLICPVGGLKLAIQNYRGKIEAEGTEARYLIQSNNFFGRAERWREYLTTTRPDPENPFAKNFI